MSGGLISFLMKKNKIDVIMGTAKVQKAKSFSNRQRRKVSEYSANHIIIATGARSRELPNLPQDGVKVIGYRQALSLPNSTKIYDCSRFWSNRSRVHADFIIQWELK